MYGAPIGLSINYIFWLLLVFPIWFLWVQFPFRLKQKDESIAAVNLIATFLFTFVFMWFFWKIFFDFANDAATVFFRSEAVFPFIKVLHMQFSPWFLQQSI
jgi:hypothetical protein